MIAIGKLVAGKGAIQVLVAYREHVPSCIDYPDIMMVQASRAAIPRIEVIIIGAGQLGTAIRNSTQ